jgi:hypothetical protein
MRKRAAAFLAMLWSAALLPAAQAGAFSFGTFTPGDHIASIELSSGAGQQLTVDAGANPSDPADDTLTFEASVSTITMSSGAVFNVPLGDVLISSTVMPYGSPTFLSTIIGGEFRNGLVADLSITDVGTGGAGLLLDADYIDSVSFTASQFASGFPINGSLSGDLQVLSGDTDFVAAFGSQASFISTLSFGTTVLCNLTNGIAFGSSCIGPTDFADFTAAPTTTITPVPEAGTLLLFGVAAAAVGVIRRT